MFKKDLKEKFFVQLSEFCVHVAKKKIFRLFFKHFIFKFYLYLQIHNIKYQNLSIYNKKIYIYITKKFIL